MSKRNDPRHKKPRFICLCNEVPQSEIKQAILDGATTVDDIYDQTLAGVGPCGGSCRPKIRKMLAQFLKDKTFPDETSLHDAAASDNLAEDKISSDNGE